MATTSVNLYTTPEELNTLHKASEVKSVSESAVAIHEKNSVARLINLAANTGESTAIWEHPLSDSLESELKSNGYTVTKLHKVAKEGSLWQISWE